MPRTRPGFHIDIEGPDGAGKGTQSRLLLERLQRTNIPVTHWAFPTYGKDPVADLIHTLLHREDGTWERLPWECRAGLFALNRKRFAPEIDVVLQRPSVLLTDRWVPSNEAHMAGYVDDRHEWARRSAWVEHLEYFTFCLPRPDLVILLTMPREATRRFLDARGPVDQHEASDAYLLRVERAYLDLKERDPAQWIHVPAEVDGRIQTPEEVHERVWAALTAHPAWQAFAQSSVHAETRV